jgi:hypothetical protein
MLAIYTILRIKKLHMELFYQEYSNVHSFFFFFFFYIYVLIDIIEYNSNSKA